jgi:ATP-dependent DNA helicase RecG
VDLIIDLIIQKPTITTLELSKATGLTRRGIEHNLKKLKDEGHIERIGPDKGGSWKVN